MLETLPITEQELVRAARRGDDDAFRMLIEPHRAKLHQHCRHILGSAHDADDALQDALLRAWRGLPGFGGDRPLGHWLYRIATNSSLDALKKRRQTVPIDGAAEPES